MIISYEIYWRDLNEEAKKRLKDLYHENINIALLAIVDIEEVIQGEGKGGIDSKG